MAEHRTPVTLALIDNFTGRMALAARAAHDLNVRMALAAATWEPHDWSDFA